MMYLVTGGAGFIGSHIVDALVKRGEQVRVLDDFSSGKWENLQHVRDVIEVIQGDIRNQDTVRTAMSGVDYVSHQASLRSVPKSMTRPLEYNEVNVGGTLNILVTAREHKVKKVVYASSSSIYSNKLCFPQSEPDAIGVCPISPYALTKKIGEAYCQLFAEVYALPTISLRYFNVYGPRQSLEDDYAVVVPKFITALLKGEALPIYGDGTQSRDFTYISDVVEANLKALESPAGLGTAYNVACGKTHTVLDLAQAIGKILASEARYCFLPPRNGDVKKTHANIRMINTDLGWEPHISFKEGLHQTVTWFKEHIS